MHKMEELRDMLCKELEAITDRGELSAGSLDIVDKLTHSIKSIDTILAMENYDDYSNDEMYYDDRSEARGRGRNAKRDSMGRYARRSYDGNSRRNSYERGRSNNYSREDAKADMIQQLREIEMDAQDEETRRTMQKLIRQAEQG